MKRLVVVCTFAGLVTMAGCGGSSESLHLEVRADAGLDLASVKGLALIGSALSERTWSVHGRDLEADPLTVGLDAPALAAGDRVSLLLVGYNSQGKASAAWSGKVDLGLERGVTATLAALDAGCDADGDGFLACGQAACCDVDAKAFVDCDDANAVAYPYDATACQACPDACGGGEADAEVVDGGNDEVDTTGLEDDAHEVAEASSTDWGEVISAMACDDSTCSDSTSGKLLFWQRGWGGLQSWDNAKAYCESNQAGLAGTGWRLPSISELRSLVIGCGFTATGGSCNITDGECLSTECRDASCDGCPNGSGPTGGCYWDVNLQGDCVWFWSSSLYASSQNGAWGVSFVNGYVSYATVAGARGVRCVRNGP